MDAPLAIEVRAYPSISLFPQAAWDGLDGVRGAPFLSHTWLETLEKTGCASARAGWQPHHLGFWQGEKLLAAAPAYLKDNSEGEFVFDWAWASAAERARIPYYPKLVVAVPFTPATASRLLVADPADRPRLLPVLAEALRVLVREEEISGAHVLFPTADEAGGLAAAGLAERHGVQFHWRNPGYGSFDDFLARFSSKRRNQIRREVREMSKQGIAITTERGRIEPAIVDAMFGFYKATVDKFTWGRQYLNRAFFEEICEKLAGKVEIVIAREGGKIIAGAFNLRGEGALFGRYWGAAVERPFLHFNVCFYHSIEACIAEKVARFEPGAGGQHKLVRGFEPVITYSAHHLAHPGLDRAVREFLAREREAVAESVADAGVAWK